jgi:GNAT superfamily N-acetyltransferase
MKIRLAESNDIPALAGLSGKLGYSSDVKLLRECFLTLSSDASHAVFVAEDADGNIAGWIHIMPRMLLMSRQIAEIGGLIVDELYRRQGVGRMLIEAAENWAFENGFESITARSNTKRPESHSFYPEVGYNYEKEQKVYTKLSRKTNI